ncbi:MAG: hypothetical protein IJ740_03040 [Ruminococcus sp.]|nr:hypothetical protein [Ruminococcus sp.]
MKKIKIKKKYIIIPVAIIILAAGGAVSYFKFFRFYFGTIDHFSELSEYEETFDYTIFWDWQQDNESGYGVYIDSSDKEAHINKVPEDALQECMVETDDSPFSHHMVFYEYDIMEEKKTGRIMLAGEYRFKNEEEFTLVLDDEYVGEATNGAKELVFKKDPTFPIGITVPTEEDFYKNKDYYKQWHYRREVKD